MSAPHQILILNGPNLNMLGVREPEIYGHETLDNIRVSCEGHAEKSGAVVDFRQSNSEGDLIEWIQRARGMIDGIIINPAAFTHTSVAILDALVLTELPVIEIHISNIFRRESFRQHSYISAGATGIISGFGTQGYLLAIDAMVAMKNSEKGA